MINYMSDLQVDKTKQSYKRMSSPLGAFDISNREKIVDCMERYMDSQR